MTTSNQCSITHSTIIHLNKTIDYYINTTKESLDLTISYYLPLEYCSEFFLTLVDLFSFYSSKITNITILQDSITTLKLINLCINIDIKSIQKLKSLRHIFFQNCTIHFIASQHREDYDFYPKNLSRWSFYQGQTDSFDQFIIMINQIGPLKFDLKLSNCFKPIFSFNHFIPLDTQLIFLDITCQYFQIDEPYNIKTRRAIFLTPILIINTQSSLCPSIHKYYWLSLKHSHTKHFSLRTFICENRLIQLNFDLNQTTITNTEITITTQITFTQSTIFNNIFLFSNICKADDDTDSTSIPPKVNDDIGKHSEASKTDDEVVQKEEEAIKLDGLSAKEFRTLLDASEKHQFQTEVNRMMKLIINSLYKNKEIFLRELISNASDALDKIRFLSLTDRTVLGDKEELTIRIKIDKDNRMLHITDTGIGMTKSDLVQFLGTIAKSDTSEFLNKVQEVQKDAKEGTTMSDLIGQFGVGFYSSFLVADKVVVTSKNNADDQYIWESDSTSFNVFKDPRGNTLGRGTTVSLHLKEEAGEYLEISTLEEIIRKYSQFINFNIYLWKSKTVKEEVPDDDATEDKKAETEKKTDDDAAVEDDKEEEKKSKTKTVDKTVWDWELMNESKPIWQRKASEVTEDEYHAFYKSFAKDSDVPMIYSHFTAEGEVTFKSILYVPKAAPFDLFSNYNKKADAIKLYVRRVFITDNFEEMMPKYLSFIRGVVDSDDLPLNVSRETLQQSKLLKVIKKKLVRKALDMLKKISSDDYTTFWKEYGTNIKLGVIEDSANRTRLAKLLRFSTSTSKDKFISLTEYVERMKPKQEHIYFISAMSIDEAQKSPFVERILKKGYEILYLTDPVDQYCMQSLPEYEGKKFQNVAKDGLELDKSDAKKEEQKKDLEKFYEPLLTWLKDKLSEKISDAKISDRLVQTPMALVASQWGYDGNMERIARAQAYQKSGGDATMNYYLNQKKTLEINPRHPLIKDLLRRVEDSKDDKTALDLANVMVEAATLRSGYDLKDSAGFADRIESMLRRAMGISLDEKVEDEPVDEETDVKTDTNEDENIIDDDTNTKSNEDKQSTRDSDQHVDL
ncbi:unnamed protein product [Rotaria sordida]|uniref:Heat shock protein 90 n=1 Tax=Rotaria sordida TaxID=392033 RepID=A0A813U9N3_9BILA|nr:unnamed protein product [Rotaria sordida]CAF1432610.1 unnamed protein product [Rotaria sordida]